MGLPRGGTERKKGGHTNFVQGPDLRILQIIPSLDQAGAEKQMVLLATGLARPEFDVHVCALTRLGPLAEPLREGGIPVESIEKRWKVDPAAYYRLRRLIQRLQPDLVHTWIFAANSYGRQAALGAGVKHVLAGERCVDRWKAWHELAIDRHLARKTDWIVTNSSGVRDFYVEHGLPREKFVIIPNGIRVSDIPAAMGQAGAQGAVLMATSGQGTMTYSLGSAVAGLLGDREGMRAVVQPQSGTGVALPLVNSGELDIGFASAIEVGSSNSSSRRRAPSRSPLARAARTAAARWVSLT